MNEVGPTGAATHFTDEVMGRLGMLPHFFRSASAASGSSEELWRFAKSAYLDSPLPSLFKERLFVHLSRFCEVRYCVVRHVGFLLGKGRPAGDAKAQRETVAQVVALLSRPVPTPRGLDGAYERLLAGRSLQAMPAPETPAEGDLFDVLTVVFLTPARSARARDAVRHALGDCNFELLTVFLAFVRTAHYWTETHPELEYEPDMQACMAAHPQLARLLLHGRDAELVSMVGQRKTWLDGQNEAFRAVLKGASLRASLELLISTAIGQVEGLSRCAFFIANDAGTELTHLVGMPDDYAAKVEGFIKIGEDSLACGLAVSRAEPVITPDVRLEPRWQPWLWLAEEYDHRACWSFPVELERGKPFGTFALYFPEPRRPTPQDLELAASLTATASIVIAQQRSLAAIRESEGRFRTLAETAPALIWQNDAAGENHFVNRYFLDYTGLAGEEVSGKKWRALVHPDDREAYVADYMAAVAEQRPFRNRNRIRRHDGQWGWFDNYAQPLFDQDRRYAGHVGVSTDVTATVQAEQVLRESEERQAFLLRFGDTLRAEPDERAIAARAVQMVTQALLVDRCYVSTFRPDTNDWKIDPDFHRPGLIDTPPVGALLASTVRTGHGNPVWNLAVVSEAPRQWTESETGLIQELAERTWAAIERARAEAALRESEQQLRDVLDSMAEGFALLGSDFTILDVNDETLRLDGRSRAELIGRSQWDAFPETEHSPVGQAFKRVLQERVPAMLEHEYRWPNGRSSWLDMRAYPTGDARVAIFWRDITDRKRAEAALRASERQLQTLMEGVPQLVWRAAAGGHWTWASPQWTAYTGQAQADSHGLGWLDPVHPNDRARVEQIWAGAAARGEFHADYRICHGREGRYRWFQTRAAPVRDEAGRIIEWLGTSTDVDDLRQLQERQQLLVAELQHRTFNLMAVVRSTADATIRSSGTLDEFKSNFRDRIDALARVQRLLSRLKEDDRVTFDELIRGELEAVGRLQNGEPRVQLNGPEGVALRSSTVQAFALALHELTTNAVKYGALSQRGASLSVRWRVQSGEAGEPWLHVDWWETGVSMPPVEARAQGTGQGRLLIEKALPYQLRAKTSFVLGADGVRCSIALPVSARSMATTEPSGGAA